MYTAFTNAHPDVIDDVLVMLPDQMKRALSLVFLKKNCAPLLAPSFSMMQDDICKCCVLPAILRHYETFDVWFMLNISQENF